MKNIEITAYVGKRNSELNKYLEFVGIIGEEEGTLFSNSATYIRIYKKDGEAWLEADAEIDAIEGSGLYDEEIEAQKNKMETYANAREQQIIALAYQIQQENEGGK